MPNFYFLTCGQSKGNQRSSWRRDSGLQAKSWQIQLPGMGQADDGQFGVACTVHAQTVSFR
jgi:hypothetical protein